MGTGYLAGQIRLPKSPLGRDLVEVWWMSCWIALRNDLKADEHDVDGFKRVASR